MPSTAYDRFVCSRAYVALMAPTARAELAGPNPIVDMVEALSDRQGELSIRLEHLSLRLPMVPGSLEVSGQIAVSLHLRELTDKEKAARSAREIRLLEP